MLDQKPAMPEPSRPQTVRKPALPALTGLRTILAINIMFFHFTPPHPTFLEPLLGNAYVFVGFFFLISGFVLAYNYADRPSLSKRAFYLARLSRVYPVYLLALVLSIPFLVIAEWPSHTHAEFFTGLLLAPLALQSWSPQLATFWNTVAWTVPAELFLYLLFPFILLLFRRCQIHIATPRRLILLILSIWLLGLVPHTIYWLTNPDHLPAPANRFTYAFWLRLLKYSPLPYLCTFTAGILLARLHAVLQISPARRAIMALTALIALGLFFAFAVNRLPYVLIHGTLLLPLFAPLLLGLASENPVAAIFSWKPVVTIGETTFSLYLLHFNAFLLIHYWHLPEHLHVAFLDPWISYLFIIALAFAVQRLYEGPARAFVQRLQNPAKS